MRKKHRISFLTREEMLKLLAGPDTATLFGVRDLAILQVLYSTGLHVTELAALNLSDIDFINQQLLVGGKKGRMVSTAVTTLMMIRGYREFLRTVPGSIINHQAVFLNYYGQRLSGGSIRSIVRQYLKRAGFEAKFGRCVLRHSFAMEACNRGIHQRELQSLLGLSSRSPLLVYRELV